MPEFLTPRVYVEESSFRPKPIEAVGTSTAAFVGPTGAGPDHPRPQLLTSLSEYEQSYGGGDAHSFGGAPVCNYMWHAARAFFREGGKRLYVSRVHARGHGNAASAPSVPAYEDALRALEAVDDVSIVAAPGSTFNYATNRERADGVARALLGHAERMRFRFAMVDSGNAQSINEALDMRGGFDSAFGAMYYPWVVVADPVSRKRIALPPSGFVAGICARSDSARGVHKAPANEVVRLAKGFEVEIDKADQDVLNPRGINCFRTFPARGRRLWGARTMSSDPEWKYVNVRRYLSYLEHSIDRGVQWVVFEPNAEPLWRTVRGSVEDFLLAEWQRGALMGSQPREAFFVKCDRTTMTQDDLDNGRLVCLVGVAPVKPAEFVLFRIGQWTADRK